MYDVCNTYLASPLDWPVVVPEPRPLGVVQEKVGLIEIASRSLSAKKSK